MGDLPDAKLLVDKHKQKFNERVSELGEVSLRNAARYLDVDPQEIPDKASSARKWLGDRFVKEGSSTFPDVTAHRWRQRLGRVEARISRRGSLDRQNDLPDVGAVLHALMGGGDLRDRHDGVDYRHNRTRLKHRPDVGRDLGADGGLLIEWPTSQRSCVDRTALAEQRGKVELGLDATLHSDDDDSAVGASALTLRSRYFAPMLSRMTSAPSPAS